VTTFWDAPLPDGRRFLTRHCLYCDGAGSVQASWGTGAEPCEECDGTGLKYRAVWTTDDGITCSMTGSGAIPPDGNTRALMELVARSAMARPES
jgi:hypothetical protein